jgi:hypothetical protein
VTTCVPFEDSDLGRCGHILGPKPAGEICDERFPGTHDCCGGEEACRPDVLGIKRCFGEGTECLADGAACAFGEQCCSGLCAPDPTGALVCGVGCVADGQACTDSAACCGGLCNAQGLCGPEQGCLANGEVCTQNAECCSLFCDPVTGLCADLPACRELGAVCTTNAECCSGLCSNGVCARACLALGATCTAHTDCCSGYCDPAAMICGEDVTTCSGPSQPCTLDADCCPGLVCYAGHCSIT